MNRIATISLLIAPGMAAATPEAEFENEIRPLLKTYCFGCHGTEKAKGGISIEDYKTLSAVKRNPKFWRNVVEQLGIDEMPPEGENQPTNEERNRLIGWLEANATKIDLASIPKDPGRVTIRRLNRTEYNHTIRDLIGVDYRPGRNFPEDGAGGAGFNNTADTLFLPPILMEKYLEAANEVLEKAFASEKTRQRILFVEPDGEKLSKEDAAKKILTFFTSFAFRRYVNDAETARFLTLFKKADERGDAFGDSIKLALKGVLVSPRFLFRSEKDQPGNQPWRIDDFELASRLSYFLWASMPDRTLLTLASQKKLREPEVLSAQVERMLADKRSMSLAQDFAGQWLGFEALRSEVRPDKKRFPEFTMAMRVSMYQEPLRFFDALVRENRSVLELLDCDTTFVNETLAKHYRIPGVAGPQMRRVRLPNRQRGGVLGMGGILTATSFPLRTSPVLRGRYVLDELLGTPPPPPPPDAGQLPADDRQPDGLSFRKRLEIHRTRSECAGCHNRIDPIGFGLENFDPIGRWRTQNDGKPVDATGKLPSGEKFAGPEQLRAVLLADKEQFALNITEKMLAYALGRGLEYYDLPTVHSLRDRLVKSGYRVQDLIHGIVGSYPFQNRRNDPIEK